jgi:tetratricopeptide (TPR) repeat protein
MDIGYGLLNIAVIFEYHFDEEYDNVLEYNKRALAIFEELEHRRGIAISIYHIGHLNWSQCNYDKAREYYNQSLEIALELNDKSMISYFQLHFAEVYHSEGNYIEAKKYIDLSYAIVEKLGDKERTFYTISYLGINYYYSGNLFKAKEKLEQALVLQKGLEYYTEDLLYTLIFLNLTYKSLNSNFDIEEINKIIEKSEKIEFESNYQLYELLEDKSYLETAYTQIQEKADNLEPDVAAKFLSYPIPKAIVEEWEKVNT